MATTYTRIKNRRGLKEDLPQPLADGEIGLATDTREVYIGAGTQDGKNADVQVTPFLDAQKVVADDLGNLTSSTTNNGVLNFNLAGTEVIGPGANVALAYNGGANYGLPTGHPKLGGGLVETDLVVTKYSNAGIPTTYEPSQYDIKFNGTTTHLTFVAPHVPEAGSKLLVSKWTKAQITEHVRARAGWEASDSSIASYNKWQEGNLASNQVFVDVTTGTGFVQFVNGTEKAALLTANANDSINTINEPATYSFLGEHASTLGHNVRPVAIDSSLKVDLDTPQQAINVSRFINKKRGSVARVASNIELFTEASYPRYQTNQYVSAMQTATLNNGQSGITLLEYPVAESNVYKIDYSLKLGSAFRTGTIHITTDGTNTVINDSHVETASTSDVTFSAGISSAKLEFKYSNANASNASLSYKIERWLQE